MQHSVFDHVGGEFGSLSSSCSWLQENDEQFRDQTGGLLAGNTAQAKQRESRQLTSGRRHVSTFSRLACILEIYLSFHVVFMF